MPFRVGSWCRRLSRTDVGERHSLTIHWRMLVADRSRPQLGIVKVPVPPSQTGRSKWSIAWRFHLLRPPVATGPDRRLRQFECNRDPVGLIVGTGLPFKGRAPPFGQRADPGNAWSGAAGRTALVDHGNEAGAVPAGVERLGVGVEAGGDHAPTVGGPGLMR